MSDKPLFEAIYEHTLHVACVELKNNTRLTGPRAYEFILIPKQVRKMLDHHYPFQEHPAGAAEATPTGLEGKEAITDSSPAIPE